MPSRFQSFRQLLPFIAAAAVVIALYFMFLNFGAFAGAFSAALGIISPFFYGFVLAYLFNIPYGGFMKLLSKIKWKFFNRIRKPLSIVLTLALFMGIIFAVLYFIIPLIQRSIALFSANFSSYFQSAMEIFERLNQLFGINITEEMITQRLQELLQNLDIEGGLQASFNALLTVPSAIISGFITLVSSIYIFIEKNKFKKFLRRLFRALLPDKITLYVFIYVDKLNKNFKQYIKIQTIDGLILGTIVTIELFIIGSPFAAFLGLMLGILNYIPFFGSIVGTIIAIIVVGFTQGLTMAAIAAVVLFITQQIDGNIIQPKLMGKSFSFSPLLVVISVTIGGAVAGVFGMIAAIPIVAVLKDILENVIKHFEKRKRDSRKQSLPP